MILLGEGTIGRVIKEFLKEMGQSVTTVDLVGNPNVKGNIEDVLPPLLKEKTTVISALPYHANANAAKIAINNDCDYFDLGGHTQTTEKIRGMSKGANCKVFSGLGLAPGHVNILAELLWQDTKPNKIDMYCGGIPCFANDLSVLNYKCTWSIDGLVNEYFNEYHCVENGFKKTIYLNENGYVIPFPLSDKYECSHTSGCTDAQIDEFVARKCDINYYTMRYPGHFELFRKLYHINPDIIDQILVNDSRYFDQDKVKIAVIAYKDTENGKQSTVHTETYYSGRYSAMQRTTAAGCVAGVLSSSGTGFLSYSDFSSTYLDIFEKLMKIS